MTLNDFGGYLMKNPENIEKTSPSKIVKYFGALFMEKKDTEWAISIGRTSWWVSFLPAVYIWISSMGESDIPSGYLTILIALTTYNFSKKAIDKATNIFGKGNGPG